MRPWSLLLFVAALSTSNLACNTCASRQDCDPGQSCDFETGRCQAGCSGPEDCAGSSRCDTNTGICVIPPVSTPRVDAGDMDAGTSSTADGGS